MRFILTFIFTLMLLSYAIGATLDPAYILKIDSQSTYPNKIYPNGEVSLNINLSNVSSASDARDIIVKLNIDSTNFEQIKSEDKIDLIKFNQSGTATLRFKVKESAQGGYYSIPLTIDYLRDNDKSPTINTQVSINVESYEKLNVVLTSYPKSKKYLDQNFNISGYVRNEGSSTLKGISIMSDFGVSKLIPLNEVSQFLGDLNPGQKKEFSFDFIIPKSASPSTYDINLIARDISNNIDLERVVFVVEDKPTVIVSSIEKSLANGQTNLVQGDDFSLSIQVENISKSRAKAIVMKIRDNNVVEGSKITYVGSLESDDSGSGVFDLKVLDNAKAGEDIITVDIEYIDDYDTPYVLTKDVSLFINKKKSSYSFLFYLIIIAGIGYGIYYYMSRKKSIQNVKNLRS